MTQPNGTYEPCPEAASHGNPFRYCPVKGCGWVEPSDPQPAVPTYLDGLRAAREVVDRQTDLAELVHFERPSDFRKGVLTCLAALDSKIMEIVAGEVQP